MKSGLDHENTKVQGIFHEQNRMKMQGNTNCSSYSNQKPRQQHKNFKCGNCESVNQTVQLIIKHVIYVDVVDILITCVAQHVQF